MQNKIQIFENPDFGKIRSVMIDGEPWFVGKDIAATLGYERPTKAVQDRVDDEDRDGIPIQDSIGRMQNTPIINESGLYSLILSSKLPTAKAFKRWVTSEVLPSIRKHGAYVTDDLLDSLIENPESAVNLFAKLKDEREQMAVLEGYVEIAKPKLRYYDIILQCPGAVLVSVIAKDYGMTAVMFNKLLHELGVQFRFKTNRTWLLYKEYDNKGYTITKTYCKGKYSYIHMCWTQKGRRFLYEFLRSHGILPQVELMQNEFITAGS